MDRKRYDVMPDGNSWMIKLDGRTVGAFDNKDDAIEFAAKEASQNEPSQVMVRRRDGTFQEERTYGDDPAS
ncbi:MAG: DUF2188 domain-containing protein, partial [Actinobacteria bacterium]|nr:DUF2188 domain-containing protein [Actinomycetota bacterium]